MVLSCSASVRCGSVLAMVTVLLGVYPRTVNVLVYVYVDADVC